MSQVFAPLDLSLLALMGLSITSLRRQLRFAIYTDATRNGPSEHQRLNPHRLHVDLIISRKQEAKMKVTPQILLALTLAIRPIAAGLGAGGYCDILNACDKGLECTYDRGRLRCHTPCKPYNGGWCPRGSTCYANSDYSEGLCLYCRKHGVCIAVARAGVV
ncbi:uncharacterized protein MYCGRDRAFT_97363 [Zymoseptoria tritici IPO323]|uniref:Uncharacterized protein n=1 Tax=Zymoseptoria tritici (strain CBS 115943 / IPO323) TaxID=336722 RepID=F9XPZ8_ZYMTI|nr:uncharacterized protein MYCGRDRAFT_97363 [Zymoseptoria tritici IPO323]EGP82553.1 hypothetical protein MYCGRDRAFT_97363 [Zymoseptoria tritici IPO323]